MTVKTQHKRKFLVTGGTAGLFCGAGVLLLTTAQAQNGAPGGSSASGSAAGSGAAATAAGVAVPALPPSGLPMRLMPAEKFRADPFEPKYTRIRLPRPLPPPPVIPPPVRIPQPQGTLSRRPDVSIGPARLRSAPPTSVLAGLPPVRILRFSSPPRIPQLAPAGPPRPGAAVLTRSPNKRLSGVVIGDSIYALLEIGTDTASSGAQGSSSGGGSSGGYPGGGYPGGGEGGESAAAPTAVTHVVQPGDEVDGIKILRIEQPTEGGRTITRMFILENNEEHYVDLRPSPNPVGAGSSGAEGGSSGGYPGGGYPGGGSSGGYSGGGYPGGGYPGGGMRGGGFGSGSSGYPRSP